MPEEQDVHISSISGSIAQWSTEATATKIQATLNQIAGQNSQLLGLLNAVKGGTKMSARGMKDLGDEMRSMDKTQKAGQKSEKIEAQRDGQKWKGILSSMGMGNDGIIDQLRKNRIEASKDSKTLASLMKMGFDEPEAKSIVAKSKSAEFSAKMRDNFTKGAVAVAGLVKGIEEATKTGFMERFDMAGELRQTGLAASLGDVNQGFIQLSKIVSETGFTFGEAAAFTKDFAKTVGVNGVQSTLKFVKAMAAPGDAGGLMAKFALDFGQVVNMSGQYLEGLRISGQLQGRSDQQLRAGMDSFMSNVQATSNVLKVSMEEAAAMMKGALSEADQGRLLTLPQEMQDSIRAGLQFAGGGEGPIMDLLAARLAAGTDQGFQLTSEFKQYSGSMIGQELIKYVQQVAPTLETQGDKAFQTQLASTLPQEVQRIIEMMGQQGTRGLVLADDNMAAIIGQINQMSQNFKDAAAGISGGGREDQVAMTYIEQQRQASVLAERSMTTLMPGFVDNVMLLTETNRKFAEQAAQTLTYNTNLLDGINNAATSIDRFLTGAMTKILLTVGEWGSMENFKNTEVQTFDQQQTLGSGDKAATAMSTLNEAINNSENMEAALASYSKNELKIILDTMLESIDTRDTTLVEKLITAVTGGGNQHTVHGDVNDALIIELQKQVAIVKKLIEKF